MYKSNDNSSIGGGYQRGVGPIKPVQPLTKCSTILYRILYIIFSM